MTGWETAAHLEDVAAEVELDDGGMLTAAVHEREADLRVRTPGERPLSAVEPHLELRLTGEDVDATVELDGGQLEALATAVREASLREGTDD
jgi:hypothetical protein